MSEAYKYLRDKKNLEPMEKDSVFLGLFCIKDPVKENVKESIA